MKYIVYTLILVGMAAGIFALLLWDERRWQDRNNPNRRD